MREILVFPRSVSCVRSGTTLAVVVIDTVKGGSAVKMGEFSFARRDSAPFFQDVLRPMRVRDGDVLEPATSPQWTQPWFGLNVAAEAARPRLPSIREVRSGSRAILYARCCDEN